MPSFAAEETITVPTSLHPVTLTPAEVRLHSLLKYASYSFPYLRCSLPHHLSLSPVSHPVRLMHACICVFHSIYLIFLSHLISLERRPLSVLSQPRPLLHVCCGLARDFSSATSLGASFRINTSHARLCNVISG